MIFIHLLNILIFKRFSFKESFIQSLNLKLLLHVIQRVLSPNSMLSYRDSMSQQVYIVSRNNCYALFLNEA